MANDGLDGFMGSGSKSFQFEHIGASVTGTILEITQRQQTDLNDGSLKYWDNGQPKMMYTIKLQTTLRDDEDDDGIRHVNVKWKSQRAVQDAVRRAGAKNIALGGVLTLTYIADAPKTGKLQPPKEWAAEYVPPDPASTFMGQSEQERRDRAYEHRGEVVTGSGTAVQARAINHHGQPQGGEPPEWARPQQGATLDRLRQQGAAGASRLVGDKPPY